MPRELLYDFTNVIYSMIYDAIFLLGKILRLPVIRASADLVLFHAFIAILVLKN